MSIRNLDAILRPESVALIGASGKPGSVGRVIADNLLGGGFDGPILLVNPKYETIWGRPVYPDVASLPVVPDAAILCTPAGTIPGLIKELGEKGTKGAIVISAGFGELGTDAGRAAQKALLEAARPHLLRIAGPNSLGVYAGSIGLNASFAPGPPKKGGMAFVAQSGAIVTTMLDWADARGIGFSTLVSLGNMADVDFGDMLDYLANDPGTEAILLYIEAVTQVRKFMSAARAAARLKPVIAIKAGRHEAAARAAKSHTGSLAGRDDVYDAAFRRAGIVRAANLEDLFDAVAMLSNASAISADDLVILTNGGGPGILATDALLDYGGELTTLSPSTVDRLSAVLPPSWSHANPVDIIGDATPERYARSLSTLLQAPEAKAILVINCPTAVTSSVDSARAVAHTVAGAGKPVLTNWLGSARARKARDVFDEARIPTFGTPEQAVRGFMHLARYHQTQKALLEAPPSAATEFSPDVGRARALLAAVPTAGWLSPDIVSALLEAYRIPVLHSELAVSPADAGRRAGAFGGAVALKIVSADIVHKADVGGVAIGLQGEAEVRSAAEAMAARVAEKLPAARVNGFLVQQMAPESDGFEVILGAVADAQFGPFLLFGAGGSAVEVIDDKAVALPPLNLALARELISRTRIYKQLKGYRHRPAVALEELALTIVKLSQLVCDLDEVAEIEINPVLVNADGLIAIDARARIAPPAEPKGVRLAIRPYPLDLQRRETIGGLERLLLRPIRPEDASYLSDVLGGEAASEDKRNITLTPRFEGQRLARLSQIDYEREMTFLLLQEKGGNTNALGFSHMAAEPDNQRAEFALAVHRAFRGRGIGERLLERLVEYARMRGTAALYGDIAESNLSMVRLCRNRGFALSVPKAGIVRASLSLKA